MMGEEDNVEEQVEERVEEQTLSTEESDQILSSADNFLNSFILSIL